GVNSRLDTIQAAVLLPKLNVLPEEIELRNWVASRYCMHLSARGFSATPYVEEHNISAWAQFTVQVENRANVQKNLQVEGIPSSVHYPIPLNKQPAVEDIAVDLRVGNDIAEKVLSLPMHPYIE